ncbi:MAG: VWA domain-containing protein [Myxococcales bacterium]|nr:VWA domain-containing protein [Myxococcales bacterium]
MSGSTSLQCTDSRNRRYNALARVIDDLLPLPNLSFGFVGFASWSRVQDFTRDRGALRPLTDPGQGLGPATDYQGALASAVRLLEQDMVEVGPAERARTRYVVVFVSDGVPEPRCRAGCEDDGARCANGADDDGDGQVDGADPDCANLDDASLRPDVLYGVCNTDQVVPDDVYVDLAGRCPAYNQPQQILERVDDLVALERVYSAGDVVLNTVFLSAPQEVITSVCGDAAAAFGYAAEPARALLQGMARAGGGVFRDVNLEVEDDTFLSFDFASLRSPYFVTEFVAQNQSARPGASDAPAAPDTDHDGLTDAEERALGLQPLLADSDRDPATGEVVGDGYSDLFEVRLAARGFDPKDPTAPAQPCEGTGDADGDGLRDCEERFLGTGVRQPDTDGDRLVDGLELRVGTDPLVADADLDPDFDGVITRDEIRAGTDPFTPDAERFRRDPVRAALEDHGEVPVPDREDGTPVMRHCYGFNVEDVRLATTVQPRDRGRNRVYLTMAGEPVGAAAGRGAVRRACVEAVYVDGGRKVPASGVIDVSQRGWDALQARLDDRFDALASCMGFTEPRLMRRFDLEDLLRACVGPSLPVGGFLFQQEELRTLLRQLLSRDLTVKGPVHPSDLFWPIEQFDPAQHCFQPWAYERLQALSEVLLEVCQACPAVTTGRYDMAVPDAGADGGADGGPDSAAGDPE